MQEPWLRGPIEGVDPFVAPLLMSFEMAREDLRRFVGDAPAERLWSEPYGLPSLGFQLRHIAGSVDRLSTYLRGEQLSDLQLAMLRAEAEPGAPAKELLSAIDVAFGQCEAIACGFRRDQLGDPRAVGRKALPTTVIGLIVHIAEHTQRHVGQAISTAKLLEAINSGAES